MNELIQISLDQYKDKNPDIRNLDQNIIQYRYNAMEKFRLKSIEDVKKERQNIIDELEYEELDNDDTHRKNFTYSKGFLSAQTQKKYKELNSNNNNDEMDKKMEKILYEQKKAIAKIKQKQRLDIQSLIKSQIDRELSEKLSIEKERRFREKEEENIREISRKKEIKEKKLKEKEIKRQNDLNRMLKEQQIKYRLKEERERQRIREMMEVEKQKKEVQKKKTAEELKKLNERKKALEKQDKIREEKIKQKQIEQTKYEQEYAKQKEKEFLESKKLAEKKNNQILERQANAREKIAKDLETLKQKIREKEITTEKNLEKYIDNREKKIEGAKQKHQRRSDYAYKVFKIGEEQHEKSRIAFEKKQLKKENVVSQRTFSRDENNKKKANVEEKKYFVTVQNRKTLDEEDKKNKKQMMDRMISIDERVKIMKIKENKEYEKKREEGNVKIIERNIINQRMQRVQAYKNQLKMDELDEKEKKMWEFQKQKNDLAKQRSQVSAEVEKQKEEVILKFDKLERQKKDIEPEMIKELFPGDNELYEKVKEMKKQQKIEEEKIYKNKEKKENKENKENTENTENTEKKEKKETIESNENNENNENNEEDENNKDKEKEIEKKVEEYKAKLCKEFNQMIEEEKENEKNRVERYENENDETKKQEIEKEIAKERKEASEKMNKT